jgi:hypothetical protein
MKIGIIITGDVRECFMKDKLKEIFKEYDVFIGSYIHHKTYIENIGKNNYSYLINPETDIRLPDGIDKEYMQQNMLQWLHLDNVIHHFEDQLLKYDVLFKYRFDYYIDDDTFLNKINVIPNTLHNESDRFFYSDSSTFIKTFKTYYDNLKNYTYQHRDINDDTFHTSWKSEPALQMHLQTNHILSKRTNICGTIIRGSYNKVYADGNKKLYINNIIHGKFTK